MSHRTVQASSSPLGVTPPPRKPVEISIHGMTVGTVIPILCAVTGTRGHEAAEDSRFLVIESTWGAALFAGTFIFTNRDSMPQTLHFFTSLMIAENHVDGSMTNVIYLIVPGSSPTIALPPGGTVALQVEKGKVF